MDQNTKKITIISTVLLGLSLVLFVFGSQQISTTPPQPLGDSSYEVKVKRVVDGDTIELLDGVKVRYIGVDTPETVDPRREVGCFGKEASEENKQLVEGKNVSLVRDVSETDSFGRLLRYVYVRQENGELLFVNDYLIRMGYAQASTYPPDVQFSDQFRQAEQEARTFSRGLWSKCSI